MGQHAPEILLDLIYDTASDSALWPTAIAGIADLLASKGGILFGQSVRASTVYAEHNARMDERCNAAYRARHMRNPWSLYMEGQPVGRIVWSDEALPVDALKRTAFYDEVLHPQDNLHNAMVALAARDDFKMAFNICRSARQGPFGAAEHARLAPLVPHLRRALMLGMRLQGYEALQRAQLDLLDRLAAGVVLLDDAGRVLLANRTARALIGADGPLRQRHGTLTGAVAPQARRLEALIRAAVAGAPLGTMSLPCPGDTRRVAVLVSAVRGRDIERLAGLGLRSPAVLVFLSDPAAPLAVPTQWLSDVYGLTETEARVALLASSGTGLADTARRLGISPNTVKTHLGRVFAKTGAGRQAELARLVAVLAQVRD